MKSYKNLGHPSYSATTSASLAAIPYRACFDIINIYIDSLLAKVSTSVEPPTAALNASSECSRLVQRCDSSSACILWEHWVEAFSRIGWLRVLVPLLPYLPPAPLMTAAVYENVVNTLFLSDRRALHDVVCRWGPVDQPAALFDRTALLLRLKEDQPLGGQGDGRSETEARLWSLETLATLYTISGKYEQAVLCYLSIQNPRKKTTTVDNAALQQQLQQQGSTPVLEEQEPYKHVFELIERHDLLNSLKDKVPALIRLSRETSAGLLVRNVDRLPVSLVVRSLVGDRRLLHWYLNAVFTRLTDYYNTQEFCDFHIMQVSLYAEFAPKFTKPASATAHEPIDRQRQDSEFLYFLKNSNCVPLELALQECQKRKPPLYHEIIYILAQMGEIKKGLAILLQEVSDVHEAVMFVEKYDISLWNDLVEYGLQQTPHTFFGSLLDYLGLGVGLGSIAVRPLQTVAQIPSNTTIANLRQKLLNILNQYNFQLSVTDIGNGIMERDTLTLLRLRNQGQRKAIRVEASIRCLLCAKPLFMSGTPPSNVDKIDALQMGVDGSVWGAGAGSDHVDSVIYSNRTSLHRCCLESLVQQRQGSQQAMLARDATE